MSSECFEKVIQIKRTNPRSASRNICMNIGNVIFGLTFLSIQIKNTSIRESIFVHFSIYITNMLPLREKSKRRYSGRGKGITISHKDEMVHAAVEHNLGNEVHASISELEAYHCKVGLS